MRNMWILLSVFISVLCTRLFAINSVSNRRLERRLGTVEDRLDVFANEIANFRDGITDIYDRFDHLNQTQSSETECTTHEEDNMPITTEKKMTDVNQILVSAFQAEKHTMHTFRKSVIENLKNNKMLSDEQIKENDAKNTKGFSILEQTIKDLKQLFQENMTAMEQEISALKLELSNLTLNNEQLIEINQNLENKLTKTEGSSCKYGWYHYLDSCYYLSRHEMTWFQALEWCKLNEAQLVEYDDWEEHKFVKDLAIKALKWSRNDWEGFWTGADDIVTEGNFVWSTSHNPVGIGFSRWLPGQPDALSVEEDCMTTLVNKGGLWNDDSCEAKHRFICEKQLFK